MSPAISQFEPRTRTSAAPGPGRCPDHLLAELLALNEEMIEQLHLERLSEAGTADFLTNMIGQHEKAAALLRAQLEKPSNGHRLKSPRPPLKQSQPEY